MRKKYLIRAGFDPSQTYTVEDAIFNNITGWNSGNQLYSYGVFNILYDGENELVPTFYKTDFSEKEIDIINEEYDAFILPLADAFRMDWEHNLIAYTKIIRKLRIPCIIIGACLRAPYDADLKSSFPFDDSVKEFLSAALDKSCVIGLRGRRTGEYLEKFGFRENRDYMAIGCPSLYTYGDTIVTQKPKHDLCSIITNINHNVPEYINQFIFDTIKVIDDHCLVLQEMDEFLDSYYGLKRNEWKSDVFSTSFIKDLKTRNRVRYFFDPQQWYDYAKCFDISIGTRFHGTVANILAGIPHVIIPIDSRMQELVDFHGITHIDMQNLNGNLLDYIDRLDFESFSKKHKRNTENYISFLRKNDLSTVFDKGIDISRGNSPLEKTRRECKELVSPYETASWIEKLRRKQELFISSRHKGYKHKDLYSLNGGV